MSPAGSPFSPFCVYLFPSLSETRGATPRRRDDTAMISRYNRVRHSGKLPHGSARAVAVWKTNAPTSECFRIVCKAGAHFYLMRRSSAVSEQLCQGRARIKTKRRSADVWRLPSHRVPEAGSRDSIIWSGRGEKRIKRARVQKRPIRR